MSKEDTTAPTITARPTDSHYRKVRNPVALGDVTELDDQGNMTDSAFDTPQYRRVKEACAERDKFPTQAWIPDEVHESTLTATARAILEKTLKNPRVDKHDNS